ncbi:hypothetical protein ALC53_01630 [Atta colombica]|uniref:Uncharacterized protein n=1 Tax=Atta colombica TaxID=520822 RepID=A0A195BTC9_9HYME|nr:hypothetical protein ALC53_01630 [Atta colombica]
MPRCSNDAGVDNLTAFCGDQGMVNDYDGENRQLRQAVGSRVERAIRALGNLLWDPLKDYLRRRVQSHLQKTIQPPIQVNRYLMNVCSKVQDFKELALRKRQRSHLTRRKTCDKSAQFVMPVTVRSHKFRKKILLSGRFRCTS